MTPQAFISTWWNNRSSFAARFAALREICTRDFGPFSPFMDGISVFARICLCPTHLRPILSTPFFYEFRNPEGR